MTNKEINRESARIFGATLPPTWAARSQEDQEDYGVDGEIEVTTPEDKATGLIFKYQLKGTEHASYDESGQLVYNEASVERFTYYVDKLKVPVVFVVCDVIKATCFWSRVQGQRFIESALKAAAAKGQQTFTIKFGLNRVLEKTESCAVAVLEAVASAGDAIALRSLQGMSGTAVSRHLENDLEIAATEKKFRMFAGLASLEALNHLLRNDDFDGALKKGKTLLESEAEDPALRIQAGVLLANAFGRSRRRVNSPQAFVEAAAFRLSVADKVLRICRQPACDGRMRLYGRAYARASRMQANARTMFALATSEKVQRLQGQTLAGPLTTIQRIQATQRVARDLRRLRMMLGEAINRGFYSLVPYLVDDLLEVAFPFTNALRVAGQTEMAGAYELALWQGVPVTVEIAKLILEQEAVYPLLLGVGLKVAALAALDRGAALSFIDRYEAELLKAKPVARAAEIVRMMRDLLDRSALEAKKPSSMAERRQYFEQQASALGVDLNNPSDPVAQVVRVGLDDLDPTRVARNCRHIHLKHESYGVPAQMLGLPSAGSKSIMCLKHGHSIQGMKLDDIYTLFARPPPGLRGQICCESCPDVNPHPDGWTWSDEWAAEQNARFQQRQRSEDRPIR